MRWSIKLSKFDQIAKAQHCSNMLRSTAQRSTAQRSTAQHSAAQQSGPEA